jgi:hypothetical protein
MPACLPADTTRLALKEVAVVEQCGRSDQVFLERPAPCVNVSGEDQSAKETCMYGVVAARPLLCYMAGP